MTRSSRPLRVRCRDLTTGGEGIAHASVEDEAVGKQTIFVPDLLPDEEALICLTGRSRRILRGEVIEPTRRSPDRVSPDCPIFSVCGGCDLRHMRYEAETAWKERTVLETLARIGRVDLASIDCLPLLPMPEPRHHYRNKVTYPLSRSADGTWSLGFYKAQSHEFVTTPRCLTEPVAGTVIRRLWPTIMAHHPDVPGKCGLDSSPRLTVRADESSGDVMVILPPVMSPERARFVGDDLIREARQAGVRIVSVWLDGDERPTHLTGDTRLTMHLGTMAFSVSPFAFFQINSRQCVRLYETVVDFIEQAASHSPLDGLLDLYCGIGSVGLFALNRLRARQPSRFGDTPLHGVELNADAVADARVNAAQTLPPDAAAVFEALPAGKLDLRSLSCATDRTLAIVDPPRRGCEPELIRTLTESDIPHVIYVSCNPATLARDLARLRPAYRPVVLRPVDMFPRTTHVETMVLMSRV